MHPHITNCKGCFSIMKYIVLKRSPANHVKIMKKLRPFTLFVRMLESIWGMPNVDYIDMDTRPRNGPNKGMENVWDNNVSIVVTAANANRNLTTQ